MDLIPIILEFDFGVLGPKFKEVVGRPTLGCSLPCIKDMVSIFRMQILEEELERMRKVKIFLLVVVASITMVV